MADFAVRFTGDPVDNKVTFDENNLSMSTNFGVVHTIGRSIPEQEKAIDITENGTTEVTPDEGFTLSKVGVTVNVPIPDGYIAPSGELEVTENGEHDVTEYASVNVNVAAEVDTSIEDGLITNALTEYSNSRITELGQYALYGRSQIKTVNFPNLVKTNDGALRAMTSLTTANVPNLTYCGNNTWYGNTKMTVIEMPLVTYIGTNGLRSCTGMTSVNYPLLTYAGPYAFYDAKSLTSAKFPLLESVSNYTFGNCVMLSKVDLAVASSIGTYAFTQCYSLTAVILRNPTMVKLSYSNAFAKAYHFLGTVNATYNPDGLKDGYIYVPAALVDSYKTATNWSTFADQFRAIEDYPEITGG